MDRPMRTVRECGFRTVSRPSSPLGKRKPHFTTKFTIRPGITIALTICLPARCSITFGSALAAAPRAAWSGADRHADPAAELALDLDGNLHGSSTRADSSQRGHGSQARVLLWPRSCQSSSARWGGVGGEHEDEVLHGRLGTDVFLRKKLVNSIMRAMAVLKAIESTSAVTALIVLWSMRFCSSVGGASWTASSAASGPPVRRRSSARRGESRERR